MNCLTLVGRISAIALLVCSCGKPSQSSSETTSQQAPATLDELGTVRLSDEAIERLGVKTAPLRIEKRARRITVGGEVLVAAGKDLVLSAPASGRVDNSAEAFPVPGQPVDAGELLFRLIPIASVDRDVRATATRDFENAQAQLELAEARLTRAREMLENRSGSQRSFEEATTNRELAVAAEKLAHSRLGTLANGSLDSDVRLSIRSPVSGVIRALRVTPGQSLPQGAPLVEIAGNGRWVRASLGGSDINQVGQHTSARAHRIGSVAWTDLEKTLSPPSADLLTGTIDLFFLLPESIPWLPGERVIVELASKEEAEFAVVSESSVIQDAEGGTWVYEQLESNGFRRRRVELVRQEGKECLLTDKMKAGSQLVSVAAREIWGFELGADQ